MAAYSNYSYFIDSILIMHCTRLLITLTAVAQKGVSQ